MPDKPKPSDLSRSMMTALADSIGQGVLLEAARVEALLEESLTALRDGRLDDFYRATNAIGDTFARIVEILAEQSDATESAMVSLDPTYGAFVKQVRLRLEFEDSVRELSEQSTMELVNEFARHVTRCSDNDCATTRAFLQVFKMRGIEPPDIQLVGKRR